MTYRVAILGLGHWYSAFGLARALPEYPHATLVAVACPDDEKRAAFRDAARTLQGRIRLFAGLPIDKLDRMSLKRRLDELGKSPVDAASA